MDSHDTSGSTSYDALSSAMEVRHVDRHVWASRDLCDMWRHQLSVPLPMGLGHLSGEAVQQLRDAGREPLTSLGQLLESAAPPVPLLRLVHRFAKSCRDDPASPLPRELALLMYYACIVAALVHGDQHISQLSAGPLLRGLRWFSRQDWVDPLTLRLLDEGQRCVNAAALRESTAAFAPSPDASSQGLTETTA